MLKVKPPKPMADKVLKNLRFGVAVGITKTATAAQDAVLKSLAGNFTLRGSWFKPQNRFGIKRKIATPAKPSAEISTIADWLQPHETGGVKTSRSGRNLAMAIGARPNKGQRIPSRMTLKALRANKNVFKLQTKHGPIIVQRVTRGKNKGLRTLYGLEKRVKIRKHSSFFDPIEKVVRRDLGNNIAREVRKALMTIK